MKVLAEISLIPLGVGTSLASYVAACERVLNEAGLAPRLHAFGTNVEGDWAQVMDAVRRCHDEVHGMGAPRISTTVKLSTRTDRDDSLDAKIGSVRAAERAL